MKSTKPRSRGRSHIVRNVSVAATLAAMIVALSACTPEDEVYFSSSGTQIQFKVCQPVEISRIEVQVMPTGSTDVSLWSTAWALEASAGDIVVREIVYGEEIEGFTTLQEPSVIDTELADVKLLVDGFNSSGKDVGISGEWIPRSFEPSTWYSSAGDAPNTEPCS